MQVYINCSHQKKEIKEEINKKTIKGRKGNVSTAR
jgi:hypothetical protein